MATQLAILTCTLFSIGFLALFVAGLLLIRTNQTWGSRVVASTAVLMTASLCAGYQKLMHQYVSTIAPHAQCSSNLKQIALGLAMYSNEFDERLPLAPNWATATTHYFKRVDHLKCPINLEGKHVDYGFNARIAGSRESDLRVADKNVVMAGEVRMSGENPVIRNNCDLAIVHLRKAKVIKFDGGLGMLSPGNPNSRPIYWDQHFRDQVAALSSQELAPTALQVYADRAKAAFPYLYLGVIFFLLCLALLTRAAWSQGWRTVHIVSAATCIVLILSAAFSSSL